MTDTGVLDAPPKSRAEKLAAAILAALDASNTPLRLVLGNDAADAISASLDNARAELTAWEPIARSTDFEH